MGRIGDSVLAAVVERYGDRERLREIAEQFQHSLRLPVALGSRHLHADSRASVSPYWVKMQRGRARCWKTAQSAMLEARRNERHSICFYSDTLRIRSLARLDVERELREAIADDQLALRYHGRYDLATGSLVRGAELPDLAAPPARRTARWRVPGRSPTARASR